MFSRGHTRDSLVQYIDSMNGVPWSASAAPAGVVRNRSLAVDVDYAQQHHDNNNNNNNNDDEANVLLPDGDEHAQSERALADSSGEARTPMALRGPRHLWRPTSAWWAEVARISLHWHGNTSLTGFVHAMRAAGMDNYVTKALSGNLPFSWRRGPPMKGAAMLRIAKVCCFLLCY
jgi:hypothetical protein